MAYIDNDHVCPECRNGKCINCTGVTLTDEDVMVDCLCPNC